jgi:hypothetical protein
VNVTCEDSTPETLTWKITKVLLIGNKNITMKNWKLMEKEANSN